MGALAMWSTLGGVGKGEVENAEAQRKTDMAQLESQRQMKLAEFEAQKAGERQQSQLGSEEKRTTQSLSAQKENVGTEQAGATGRTQLEIDERREANATTNRARIQVGAGHDAARRDAAATTKAGKSGWSTKVVKMQGFDPASHLPTENDTIALTHPSYGTFIQQGDKFVPQGTEPKSIRRAPVAAVNDLLTDPDKADDFVSAYHYLPMPYFKVLDAKGKLNMANNTDVNAAQDKEEGVDSTGRTAEEVADDNAPAQ